MKHFLVITSSVRVAGLADGADATDLAIAGERARLERYLYGGNELVAFVSDVQPAQPNGDRSVRFTALVRSVDQQAADYQSGRLQSGLFGVRVLHDERAAKAEVLGSDWDKPVPVRLDAVLQGFATTLVEEAVLGSLGLDDDALEHSYTVDPLTGDERPRTEDDLARDLTQHEVEADALDLAAELLRGYTVQRCEGSRVAVVGPADLITYGSQVECPSCRRTLGVQRDDLGSSNAWVVPNHAVIVDRP